MVQFVSLTVAALADTEGPAVLHSISPHVVHKDLLVLRNVLDGLDHHQSLLLTLSNSRQVSGRKIIISTKQNKPD